MVEKIMELLNENQYPLDYVPENWENFPNANCYNYALGLKINQGFLIGDFIGRRVTEKNSLEMKLEVFKSEMDALGFYVTECETEDVTKENCFKIYLEWNSNGEYHFLHEDSDKRWSHIMNGKVSRRDQAGYIIEDPDCMLDQIGNTGQCFMLHKK